MLTMTPVRIIAITILATLFANADEIKTFGTDKSPVAVQLVSETVAIQPGKPFMVGLRIKHDTGYHTYWKNPGTVGLATAIEWKLPDGFTAGSIQWPAPELSKMGVYTVWGYEHDVLLMVKITPPKNLEKSDGIQLTANARWMACARTCHPGWGKLSITLPVTTEKPATNDKWKKLFDKTRHQIPTKLTGWKASARRDGKDYVLALTRNSKSSHSIDDLYFFSDDGRIDSNEPQPLKRVGKSLVLKLKHTDLSALKPKGNRMTGVIFSKTGLLPNDKANAYLIDVKIDD